MPTVYTYNIGFNYWLDGIISYIYRVRERVWLAAWLNWIISSICVKLDLLLLSQDKYLYFTQRIAYLIPAQYEERASYNMETMSKVNTYIKCDEVYREESNCKHLYIHIVHH